MLPLEGQHGNPSDRSCTMRDSSVAQTLAKARPPHLPDEALNLKTRKTPQFSRKAYRWFWRTARRLCPVLSALTTCALISTPAPALADNLKVVTTIKPIHALAAQVMDGIAEPRLLIDGAQSPHVFALKPSDAAALNRAHLFVRIGPTLEPFSEKIRAALPKSVRILSLINAPGLRILPIRESGAFEAHDHADHGHDDHHDAHGHDHDDEDHARDPHIWLDPLNAGKMVDALVATLVELAPQHKAKLQKNGAAARARLKTLDAHIRTKLATVSATPFIVFHDAFQYFEKRFELNAAGAITLQPEVPLSAKRLRDIRKKMRQAGVTCLFSEPQFAAKRLAAIAEGTAAKIGTLDPLGYDIPPGKDAYDQMMDGLAHGFLACLKR